MRFWVSEVWPIRFVVDFVPWVEKGKRDKCSTSTPSPTDLLLLGFYRFGAGFTICLYRWSREGGEEVDDDTNGRAMHSLDGDAVTLCSHDLSASKS
ncbi:hypothetical protein OIU74_013173 [Salix koriyanagi]|uniref:Uncharacterized protein n=1 Tax=Salix koriyanagi TaxID=2511006 RepID=A0A9Q0T640_9ROSI|nr:hypothetical protein OIU74_013173 [Salix koriyanagi]